MRQRLKWLIVPHLLLTLLLVAGTQVLFLETSLHADIGLGQSDPAYSLVNYATIWSDEIYRRSLVLTFVLSFSVVVLSVIVAYPAAYMLSRLHGRVASLILTFITGASFLSAAIKILGLVIIFGSDGPVNRLLRATGLVEEGIQILGSLSGVAIGYLHLSMPFTVLMIYVTLHSIPVRLEEAARVHGASSWRVFRRVVFPLSLPGVLNTALTEFNLLMGAFVIAAILGGGKILTFPVLIQRTLMMFNDYGMAAALAAVLLVLVLAVNILAGLAARAGTAVGVAR